MYSLDLFLSWVLQNCSIDFITILRYDNMPET